MMAHEDRFYNLPESLQILVYEFDSTYRIVFRKVLIQLKKRWISMNRTSTFIMI